ncbi:Importin-5 [Homalodisca vitripennis]|nr:Importin-5 [Homalodisca vitripennis]
MHRLLTGLRLAHGNPHVEGLTKEAYNALPLETKVVYLLNTVQNQGSPRTDDERQMAAVLLRRLFTAEFNEFYSKLAPEAQQQLKEQLLLAVQMEQVDSLRRKICDVVAEVARNLLDDDGNNLWPEFLQFLFQCANGPSPHLKEAALRMFTYYVTWTVSTNGLKIPNTEYSLVTGFLVSPARSVPGVFGNHQSNYLNLIKEMLHQSLMDTSSYHVRFQAVRSVAAFILLHEKEIDIQKHFVDLLPLLIQVIGESVQQQDDDALLKSLIDMCESTPKFLRSQVDNILDMCLKVFSNEDIGDSWRHLALEVLVTLAETAPPMMRKESPKYLPILVPLILKMMTDLDDDDDWSVLDEISEDDNDSNNVVAESALDRLACSLGGKTMFPQIVQNIPDMMKHPDWKYRHAALMAISAVGEGCQKHMEESLPFIVDAVLRFISDPLGAGGTGLFVAQLFGEGHWLAVTATVITPNYILNATNHFTRLWYITTLT